MSVGYVFLRPDQLTADSISAQVWRQLSAAINALCARFGLSPAEALPVDGIPVEEALADDAPSVH
jgi:hypothetical protein